MIALSAALLALPPPAGAAWTATATVAASGRADALPAPAAPAATVSGATATVSWPAVTMAAGGPASGYRVTRVDTSTGVAHPATSGCAGTVVGATCTDAALPTGRWAYRVQATRGPWLGPVGPAGPTVAVDATAPTVPVAVLQKFTGGTTGSIREGGSYRLFASVTDLGSVTSGVASVRADASSLSAGAGAVPLVAGSWTIGGTTYGYRSAQLTASNPLAAGSHGFTLTASDGAGNGGTSGPFPVVVDNTAPVGVDVQATNGGATPGRAEADDVVTLTFSEPIDPDSVLEGWGGTATPVTVRLTNNGGGDRLQVRDGGALPLGTVFLADRGYVTGTRSFAGSTMTLSGSTVVIVLGAPNGATGTVTTPTTASWTPSASAHDPAGNAVSTASVDEGGAADVQF